MTSTLRRRAGSLLSRLAPLFPAGMGLGVETLGAGVSGMIENDMRKAGTLPVADRALAIDVGANRGWFTWALYRQFDRVLAIEANPRLANRLKSIAPRNVRVEAVALSDHTGEGLLRIPVRAGQRLEGWAGFDPDPGLETDTFDDVRVPLRRLDDLVDEPVGLIKIDVEGHEAQVLAGAATNLRKWRPVLLVEIRADMEAAVLAQLSQAGYVEQPWGSVEQPCNNRLFVPEERATPRAADPARPLQGRSRC